MQGEIFYAPVSLPVLRYNTELCYSTGNLKVRLHASYYMNQAGNTNWSWLYEGAVESMSSCDLKELLL